MAKNLTVVNVVQLFLFILICQAAGLIGSFFTAQSVRTWYVSLQKPAFNPPSWVFGPVWTALYLMMGIAAYLVWRRGWDNKAVKVALGVFLFQLILNGLWSFLFFGMKSPYTAFVEIAALWLAILATILLFSRLSKAAAWLLIPYILWVSFAAVLNFTLWRLNT